MRNIRLFIAIFISALLLQSCSVSYLQLRNELRENPSSAYSQPCNVKYSIYIEGHKKRVDAGDVGWRHRDSLHEDRLQERIATIQKIHDDWLQKYIEPTQEIISKKGCVANYVEHEEEANLKIRIVASGFRLLHTAPQDWLTGLSFGLIPSWKIEKDGYKFYFENASMKREHSYSVDKKTFAHLILFPIFWVTFITLDEMDVYKKALINFLES
jgi:hypothetical protein